LLYRRKCVMKILVAGISVRAMVESAVHSGYPVIALDAFGDRDLRELTEAHSLHHDFHARYSSRALYEASRQLHFDSVAYSSNLENHPEILDRFAENHEVIGNAPEVIRRVRCWAALFTKVRQAGFLFPDTIFEGNEEHRNHGGVWLIKPVLSGGGRGISFARENQQPGPQSLLQQYIPGTPCSASFVANGSECVVIGITQQLIGLTLLGAEGFRYCGNILPFPDPGRSMLEQVRRLAAFLTLEFGLVGVNGIDFIFKDDQVVLTEVNPRYTASMELVEAAYGLPIFQLHVKAVLERKLPEFRLEDVLNARRFFGKGILFAERDAAAADTQDWAARQIRDIPASGEKLRQGSPICTIMSASPTYAETLAGLASQASMLKREIYG
jgi:predicted ATP-grasp superfamily ATP-dependent carboligase